MELRRESAVPGRRAAGEGTDPAAGPVRSFPNSSSFFCAAHGHGPVRLYISCRAWSDRVRRRSATLRIVGACDSCTRHSLGHVRLSAQNPAQAVAVDHREDSTVDQNQHDQEQPDDRRPEEQWYRFVEDGKGGHRKEPVSVEDLEPDQ